ncbi:MAG: hypothetical protein ACK4UJ_07145 [Leptonema sp. (in: bacteria)]
MFYLVWLILLVIFQWIVLVISYWENLIRSKEEYTRDELIDFLRIYDVQLRKMNPNHSPLGYLAFLFGIGVSWILTLIGGFLSPDTGPEPDFATGEVPNYFFQSFLFVGMLHILWPSLIVFLEEKFVPDIVLEFFKKDKSFFNGLAINLVAISFSSWGVYHSMSFLFALINGIVLLTYASYQIQKKDNTQENLEEDLEFDDKKNKDEELEV